ncbi:hypothetical protein O3P69_005178 [Scylla paramamosain]|uniref:Uncharacterized protein n=1 Tax=Scylla paramamosain TaxID=85552 RepID=A0AAW0UDH6_SCYPA
MSPHAPGRAVWAIVGVLAWWAAWAVADLPPHLSALAPQSRAIETHSYYSYNKFAHKECRANGRQGVCMFVWECIKSDGKHAGMCMDGFMFGSCCIHKDKHNDLAKPEQIAPRDSNQERLPAAATRPLHDHHDHFPTTRR